MWFAAYLACVSLLAVILTLHDKRAARRHKWRGRYPGNHCIASNCCGTLALVALERRTSMRIDVDKLYDRAGRGAHSA